MSNKPTIKRVVVKEDEYDLIRVCKQVENTYYENSFGNKFLTEEEAIKNEDSLNHGRVWETIKKIQPIFQT